MVENRPPSHEHIPDSKPDYKCHRPLVGIYQGLAGSVMSTMLSELLNGYIPQFCFLSRLLLHQRQLCVFLGH